MDTSKLDGTQQTALCFYHVLDNFNNSVNTHVWDPPGDAGD